MAFQLQVSGNWAGETGGWRPAIAGTLNQTGLPDGEASTFDSREDAKATAETVVYPELPEEDARDSRPLFRLLDLESGSSESA